MYLYLPPLNQLDNTIDFGLNTDWGEWQNYFVEQYPQLLTYLVTPHGEMALERARILEESSIEINKDNTKTYRYLDIEVIKSIF